MGTINRRTGLVSGSTRLFQQVAAFTWKGIQVVRIWGKAERLPTIFANDVRATMTAFAERFHLFTLDQQALWDQYAASLGSAVKREMSDTISHAKDVIVHHRRGLESGINAYIAANIDALLSGLATPLDIPPIGTAAPAPPRGVVLVYAAGSANLTFITPTISGTPFAALARVWAKIYVKGNHAQMALANITLPATSASFTTIRTGHAFASPQTTLLNIKGPVTLRVQMDTLIQRSVGEAPVIGPGSNVAETIVSN